MQSNLTGTFMACKAVLSHMIERGSAVLVNLTSEKVARRGRCRTCVLRSCKVAGGNR